MLQNFSATKRINKITLNQKKKHDTENGKQKCESGR